MNLLKILLTCLIIIVKSLHIFLLELELLSSINVCVLFILCRMQSARPRSWCWCIKSIKGGYMCLRTGWRRSRPLWPHCPIQRETWIHLRIHCSSYR